MLIKLERNHDHLLDTYIYRSRLYIMYTTSPNDYFVGIVHMPLFMGGSISQQVRVRLCMLN